MCPNNYFLKTIEVRSRRLERSSRSHVLTDSMMHVRGTQWQEHARGAAAPRQRGCVRRLCSAPKLAAPRVMTQVCADQAADGSGSCRSVGRVSTLGAVCRGVSEVWCVVGVGSRLAWLSIFKETGQSSRQNPKKNPVGSQSSRRLAALDGPAALRHCVRCYLQKNTSLSCTFWEPDPAPSCVLLYMLWCRMCYCPYMRYAIHLEFP